MIRTRSLALGVLVVSLLLPELAFANEEEDCTALLAPSSVSLRDTGLDQARAACGANSLSVGSRAFVLLDTPNFYGTLSTSLFVDWRRTNLSGFEFGVGFRLIDYRFVQSVVFSETETSVGPLSLHIARPVRSRWWGKPVAINHALRFEVPLTNSSAPSVTVAASPSIMATMLVSDSFHLHSRIAGLLQTIMAPSGPQSRAALLASADLGYQPVSFASLLVGAEVQGGWYGVGLDHLQLRGGIAIAVGSGRALELTAGSAVLGSERADLALWFGYRSSDPPKKKKRSRLKDWAR